MKRAIFLGASNTYGCGVQVFQDKWMSIDAAKKIDKGVIASCDESNIEEWKFMRAHRYTSRLASYLNRIEVNVSQCGGSPAESLHLLQTRDLTDVDYIFFEFSHAFSYFDRFIYTNGREGMPRTPGEIEAFLTNGKKDRPELRKKIKQWVIEFDPIEFIDETMKNLEQEFQKLKKDKKIIVIWWRSYNYLDATFEVERYPFLKPYTVKFPFLENENNYSVHNLIDKLGLTVAKDHPYGQYMAYPDDHASLRGHDLVYKTIVNHINEKESTNSW